MQFIRQIFESKELKNRLLFTALVVLVYRIGSHIPVPGVDIDRLNSLF
ncbi:preprotein translocase subunit SecY, partial [bacterium]|nr:preprotein translocase subunit SecY [bacterium]